jgi:hypothetical protein
LRLQILVRSLTLDDLDEAEYALILRIGNKISNEIWEGELPAGIVRPTPLDSYAIRDRFIRSKYEEKMFLLNSSKVADPELLQFNLQIACIEDNVVDASKALALGALPNLIVGSDFMSFVQSKEELRTIFDGTETALHVAVKRGSLGCSVLLILNGGDTKYFSSDGKCASDLARDLGFDGIYSYFNRKSEILKS